MLLAGNVIEAPFKSYPTEKIAPVKSLFLTLKEDLLGGIFSNLPNNAVHSTGNPFPMVFLCFSNP